jgi:hypothetical protein
VLQVSTPLQAMPSLHWAFVVQHPWTGVCVQPSCGSQASAVQTFASSQLPQVVSKSATQLAALAGAVIS